MNAGTLYLIPVGLADTPWQDFLPQLTRDTAAALRHFVVENAKTARAELKRLEHPTSLRELDIQELPREAKAAQIAELLAPLRAGHDLGLMSEAGCPAVADPGALLVRAAHREGFRVVPRVGPSSILLALMAAGLNGQSFAFHGYLPVDDAARTKSLRELEAESRRHQRTQIFIETPYRNNKMLAAILSCCQPHTRLCVASQLTAPDERVESRSVAEWQRRPEQTLPKAPAIFLLLAD